MPNADVTEVKSKSIVRLQRIGAVLIVVVITVVVLLFRGEIAEYEKYGYLGIFLTTLVASATVVLPVPGLAIVYVAGSVWNPVLVGLAAGFGDAIGEATGYLAGFAGQGLVEDATIYRYFENWMRRNGFLAIFFLSAIPNPFFDLAGIAAGASGFSPRWFFLATWMGKTIKNVAVAVAGYYSIPLFANSVLPGLTTLLQ